MNVKAVNGRMARICSIVYLQIIKNPKNFWLKSVVCFSFFSFSRAFIETHTCSLLMLPLLSLALLLFYVYVTVSST